MATSLSIRANLVDADIPYVTTPADYITLDLTNDYLIWSENLEDLMTHEPTADELNAHAVIIDELANKTVPECLVMDYSHNWGGVYYTHLIKGMGENKRYVFGFSFDGDTANEPQLEAWDDSDHDTIDKHVLGDGTPANSMVKAICTTGALPGASWVGTSIAGSSVTRIIKLNDGNGALPILESGETSQELYANIKIEIPMAYATPAVESFVLTVRYTWQT
jgi:hypothetical protein